MQRIPTLAAAALLALAPLAHADYQIWYDDSDQYPGITAGDVTNDGAKLVPPPWACGVRLIDPDYYKWIGDYGNVIQSVSLNSNLDIWLGIAGCNKPLKVETQSGGTTYPPVEGTHYGDIQGASGSLWINQAGSYPSCGGTCTPANAYKAAVTSPDWSSLDWVMLAAQDGVRGGSAGATQAQLRLDDATQRTAALQSTLAKVVSERRRSPWGAIETSVRSLEDQALQALATAATRTADCRRGWQGGRASDGALACGDARRAVRLGETLMRIALDQAR